MKYLRITDTKHNQTESIPLVEYRGELVIADAPYHLCDVLGNERAHILADEIMAQVRDGETSGEQEMFQLPVTWEVTGV